MARNTIAANLLMVMLLAGGLWTMATIQKEVFPEFALDVVEVEVGYPGAAPTEVEQGILRPVEEAVRSIDGIDQIVSNAREGRAHVSIELVAGTNGMKAFQDIDQAISRIRTFPDDVEEPEVSLQSNQREVMVVGLYGEVDFWALRQVAEQVRDLLLSTPGVTQVAFDDLPEYVTHVEIPQARLRELGLTLEDVSAIISASSADTPVGSIATTSGEILLRTRAQKQWADELAEIEVVASAAGGIVRLGDIASIRDGFEESGFIGEFNRTPSIDIEIYRTGDQSPLDIAEAVQGAMEMAEASFPPGVRYRFDSNAADDFRERLGLLTENGALAVFIVLAVLALFLELRLAFWVMMGMTISFVGAMVFMPLAGLSINMISMFGFLVVLGIVVDDAIVIGENVYEYRQRGMPPLEAAIAGARDVSTPVIFAILTNIIAFVPLLFIPGVMGKYWWPLPAVVIIVLAVSLFEALFILPAHLGHVAEKRPERKQWLLSRMQRGFATRFDAFVNTRYRSLLGFCLRHRYVTLSGAVSLLIIVGAFAASDHMGIVLMPESAADEIEAGVRLPVGTTEEQAVAVARDVTEATHRMFEAHDLFAQAEGIKTNVRGQNFVDVELVLRPPDERTMTARQIIELWRAEIGDIPGVDQITFEAERGPGGWRQDIEIDVSHTDVDTLEAAATALVERMETFAEARNVNDNIARGMAQFDVILIPEARRLGLTADDIGAQLRDAFFGGLALRQLRGTNEVEVRVKFPRDERNRLSSLEEFVVRTPSGVEVPLMDVARVERGEAFTSITRRDGRRAVTIGLDAEPPSAVSRLVEAARTEVLPQLRADFPGTTWTFEGNEAEMRESTASLYGGFALALFVIYALLAVALGSYAQPMIVMGAIPFGLVGAVLGHLLLGYDLSLVSTMGIVALSGVVLNDSLIMIDYANKQRAHSSLFDAVCDAGVRRFRPILLTTLTTFGGLTPIILETSAQARQLIPMAISLGFGIVFATAIILLIVPCLYLVFEDVKGAAK
jgi:multidrug efflux pump subunit AcrB